MSTQVANTFLSYLVWGHVNGQLHPLGKKLNIMSAKVLIKKRKKKDILQSYHIYCSLTGEEALISELKTEIVSRLSRTRMRKCSHWILEKYWFNSPFHTWDTTYLVLQLRKSKEELWLVPGLLPAWTNSSQTLPPSSKSSELGWVSVVLLPLFQQQGTSHSLCITGLPFTASLTHLPNTYTLYTNIYNIYQIQIYIGIWGIYLYIIYIYISIY